MFFLKILNFNWKFNCKRLQWCLFWRYSWNLDDLLWKPSTDSKHPNRWAIMIFQTKIYLKNWNVKIVRDWRDSLEGICATNVCLLSLSVESFWQTKIEKKMLCSPAATTGLDTSWRWVLKYFVIFNMSSKNYH